MTTTDDILNKLAAQENTNSIKMRRDIIEEIEKENPDLSLEQIDKMVEVILNEMSMALSFGDRIEIRGFGSMSLRLRDQGVARNPRNGATVKVGERAALHFRPSREVIKQINENADNDNNSN